MLIVFGLHRKRNRFSTSVEECLFCRRPTPHDYSALKKAAHVMWIPLFPLGSELLTRCQHCGNEWKVLSAPPDTSFYAYAGLVALLYGSNLIGAMTGFLLYTMLLVLPAILLSLFYLITVPGAYDEYRGPSGVLPPTIGPGGMTGPAPQSVIGPPTGTIDLDCKQCLRRFQVPYGVPMAICPFCGAPQVRRPY